MRFIVFTLFTLFSHTTYANCEANIVIGSHSAVTQTEAMAGALEDAKDVCYPGESEPLEIVCESTGSALPTTSITVCKQHVSCTVCGEGLQRKYEAID